MKKPNSINGIFLTDRKAILRNSQLFATEFNKLPIFDPSAVFFLDVLGKGGFGVVQKHMIRLRMSSLQSKNSKRFRRMMLKRKSS